MSGFKVGDRVYVSPSGKWSRSRGRKGVVILEPDVDEDCRVRLDADDGKTFDDWASVRDMKHLTPAEAASPTVNPKTKAKAGAKAAPKKGPEHLRREAEWHALLAMLKNAEADLLESGLPGFAPNDRATVSESTP